MAHKLQTFKRFNMSLRQVLNGACFFMHKIQKILALSAINSKMLVVCTNKLTTLEYERICIFCVAGVRPLYFIKGV